MNPVPLLLIIVTLPLLLGGCGEKKESVGEVNPVEEKQEVKEEAKLEEPVAETKPELEGVNEKELEYRVESDYEIIYLKDSDAPYTGKVFRLHENGQLTDKGNYKDGKFDGLWIKWYENGKKKMESNYKDGKIIGLQVIWHENGQKRTERIWKDGEEISAKYWNSKGKPVEIWAEAFK